MTDASNPTGEVALEATTEAEAVAPETEERQEEATDDNAEGQSEGGEPEGESEEIEEIELNFGGDKLRVPKSAIPQEVAEKISEFSKNLEAGVTKKFQEVAETRKSLEAREKAVEKLFSLNGEALQSYSKGLAIRSELEQLSQVDLNAMWQSDPDQARRISDTISRKQAEFQSVVAQVAQKETELTQAQQAELARRADEGRQLIEKRVKGFKESEVVDYVVKTYGMTREQAETWPLNPMTAEMAHKAMLYDRMQTAKPAPKQAAPVVPMKAKGNSTVVDVSKLSGADMAKYLGYPS